MSVDLSMARLVAQAMCPERAVPGAKPPAPEQFAALVAACRANKVPLLALDERNPALSAFFASDVFRSARDEQQASWAAQREQYLLVREAFAASRIQDVLIKAAGIAPSMPYTSDNVDTLVAREHGPQARRVLLDLGYVELKNVEEPSKFLFRKFHAGVSISAIHLHEFVGWGTGFLSDEQVLAHARPASDDPALTIPSREDALLITVAHAFYEDKAVKLGDLWKVMHILDQGELDWDAIYALARRRGWEDGLSTCVTLWAGLEQAIYGADSFPADVREAARQGMPAWAREYVERRLAEETRFPCRVAFSFSKRLYYAKVLRDGELTARQKRTDIARHSLAGIRRRLPFRSQRPMLITLSGIDGSGKTAHANALRQALETCDIDVRAVWSRGGSSPLADFVIRLVKPLLARRGDVDATSDSTQARVERKTVWLRRPWLRRGWTALVVTDLLLRYWVKIALPLLLGRVVISDRYIYDALVELAVLTGRPEVAESFSARLLTLLTSRPRRAYLLAVSPEEAGRRKPDEPVSHLEAQAHVYQWWASRWKLQVVDTEADFAEATDTIAREVLTDYYRDWRTVINGLFLANPQRNA
ncbi:MAG: hypothetical protein GX552_04860 [Chloroflexi bacterium]|jgi:thymidylate kinase|nr:hypothetical protein [Chloroflexota bacterium]